MKLYFSQASKINQLKTEHELRKNTILEDIEKTKQALEVAYCGFDNVTEPDLIDCYIYEVNSVLKRYKFLLEEMAEMQLLSNETETDTLYTEAPVSALIG